MTGDGAPAVDLNPLTTGAWPPRTGCSARARAPPAPSAKGPRGASPRRGWPPATWPTARRTRRGRGRSSASPRPWTARWISWSTSPGPGAEPSRHRADRTDPV